MKKGEFNINTLSDITENHNADDNNETIAETTYKKTEEIDKEKSIINKKTINNLKKANKEKIYIDTEELQDGFLINYPILNKLAKYMYIIFLVYISLSLLFLISKNSSIFEYFNQTSILAFSMMIFLWKLKEFYPAIILGILLIFSKSYILISLIRGYYFVYMGIGKLYIISVFTILIIISLGLFVYHMIKENKKLKTEPRILKIFKS